MYAFGSLFSLMAIIPKIIDKNVASNYSTRPVGFPYHVEYFVDLDKYYYPVLIHNYLATAIRLTIIVASDSYVAILVQHCCALFSIVRYVFDNINCVQNFEKWISSLFRLLDIDWSIYENLSNRIKNLLCLRKMIRFTRILLTAFENTKMPCS